MGKKRMYRKACLGGTFDVPKHKGHLNLLDKAFHVADFCLIGLMTDEYVALRGKEGVKPYPVREEDMVKTLTSMKIPPERYKISPLGNFYGPEVLDRKAGIEALIVGKKNVYGARGINILREDMDLKPLDIVEVETVMAKDNKPISSTRIRNKEIDKNGKIKKN